MVNKVVADLFVQVADLLEITGGDRFRVNSYRRAARTIEELTQDLAELARRDELESIQGIGKGTADRIREYLATGQIQTHQELLAQVPPGLLRLLEIPGLGPQKVQQLYNELKIGCIEDLKAAIAENRIVGLAGFGEKSVHKIAEGIAFLERSAGRVPLGVARPVGLALREQVLTIRGVRRAELVGSLRRGQESIGDLDILCVADDGAAVVQAFTALPAAMSVRAAGDTKGSILVANPLGGEIQVDLRVVPPDSFGAALQYFTGSKQHNVRLRELAIKKGYRLNEYGLFKGEQAIAGKDEAGIYKALGLPFIPPEMREDRGEIDLEGELPELVGLEDIRGDLHMHTVASDGKCTIEQMAEAAKARGYQHICITDHSRSSVIANGLSVERLLAHMETVRRVNDQIKGITIWVGIECDILSDGTLDYPDEILARLDWVVASIHAAQTQDREKITRRCVAALENPYVCVLGHPSGRLLGQRDAMDVDWDTVIKTAARTGTALEINSSWKRLDLKDVHVRQAMEAGCWLSINTDSHHVDQLDQMALGVQTARRGWATKDRVLNTLTTTALRKWIEAKRQRRE